MNVRENMRNEDKAKSMPLYSIVLQLHVLNVRNVNQVCRKDNYQSIK